MKTDTIDRRILWAVVVILLLTTAIVSSHLRYDILSSSEDNSVRHLYNFGERFTLAETIVSVDRTSPQHVPAFHLQLSVWADLVGLDYGMLRVLSLYSLLLGLAMMFRIGRDLFDQKTGLLAVFLVATCAYPLYYAHEIRMYTLAFLQTAVLFWLYWRIMMSARRVRWYHFLLLFVVSSYAIYTHTILIFPLVGIGIYHLLFAPKNRLWLGVAIAEVLAGVTFLYWLPNLISGARQIKDLTETNQTAIEVLTSSVYLYSNGFWIAVLGLTGVAIWAYPRYRHHLRYILTLLIAVIVAMLLANTQIAYIPAERMRYTIVWLPALAMVLAVGLRVVWTYSRWLGAGIAVLWLGMFAWFMPTQDLLNFANVRTQVLDQRMPFYTINDVLENDYHPMKPFYNRIITFDSVFGSDYESSILQYYSLLMGTPLVSTYPTTDEEITDYHFDQIADGEPGFWFAYRQADEEATLDWIASGRISEAFGRYHLCQQDEINQKLVMQFYLDNELPCLVLDALDREAIVFDNGYVLRNYVISPSDSHIEVSFLWDDEIVFDNSYGYSLQVFRDGEKVGQADSPVHAIVTHSDIPLESSLVGSYDVRLILYATDTVESVSGQTEDGATFERDVTIGQVEYTDD